VFPSQKRCCVPVSLVTYHRAEVPVVAGNRAGMMNKEFIVGVGSCVGELLFSHSALCCCVALLCLLYVFIAKVISELCI